MEKNAQENKGQIMSVRIDKFIWCCRLSKTRSKATESIKKGKVKLNNDNVKPSKEVQIGDLIQINKANAVFEYKVLSLLKNRVGAKLVEEYIKDVSKQEEVDKYKTYQAAQKTYRQYGTGKPTKKDRRSLEEFLDWDEDFEEF
jgi:ribosome-associated heat shock protein Hsp15